MMLKLFSEYELGDRYDEVAALANEYLSKIAADIANAGTDVIFEGLAWTRENRREATEFFRHKRIAAEWHYIDVSDKEWKARISKRNQESNHDKSAYFVDENLTRKCVELFELPLEDEIDVHIL